MSSRSTIDISRLRQDVERTLTESAVKLPDLQLVVLSSTDGHLLGSWYSSPRDGHRIGAIMSSLLAIHETAGKELRAGSCNSAIVSTEQLNIVVTRLRTSARPLIMTTAFGTEMMLGSCVRHTSDIGDKVRLAVDSSGA